MSIFTDVETVGINGETSIIRPEGNSEIHVELNQVPPGEWGLLFNNEWKANMHSNWQRAYVSGKEIVIEAHPNNFSKYHSEPLEIAVKAANQAYRQLIFAHLEAEKAEREQERKNKEILRELNAQFKKS